MEEKANLPSAHAPSAGARFEGAVVGLHSHQRRKTIRVEGVDIAFVRGALLNKGPDECWAVICVTRGPVNGAQARVREADDLHAGGVGGAKEVSGEDNVHERGEGGELTLPAAQKCLRYGSLYPCFFWTALAIRWIVLTCAAQQKVGAREPKDSCMHVDGSGRLGRPMVCALGLYLVLFAALLATEGPEERVESAGPRRDRARP